MEKVYSEYFNISLDCFICDRFDSIDIDEDEENRNFEIDEKDRIFFSKKQVCESSIFDIDNFIFNKEEEKINDISFIYNDENDYLGIINNPLLYEKNNSIVKSFLYQSSEDKSSKIIYNKNIIIEKVKKNVNNKNKYNNKLKYNKTKKKSKMIFLKKNIINTLKKITILLLIIMKILMV